MTPEELRDALEGTVFGPVRFVGSTGSTNADLLAAARSGAPEGAVLVADHQTAGRGRRGRSWVAPAGSALLASVLLRPRWETGSVALLSPATALAVRDACASYGAAVALKWPNDVVGPADSGAGGTEPGVGGAPAGAGEGPAGGAPRGEAKLAGVLAEFDSGGSALAVVVGFGVNVLPHEGLTMAVAAADREDLEAAGGGRGGETTGAGMVGESARMLPPVALAELASRPVDRNQLLVAVLLRLDAWYRRLGEPQGAPDLLAELRRHSATLGRQVRVQTPGGVVVGRAADFTAQGHLVVATAAGPVTVAAGDCHHLRPDAE